MALPTFSKGKIGSVVLNALVAALETALALLAPKASPALTGVPTAPTAAANTNTTQVATCAFAKAEADAAESASQPKTGNTFTVATVPAVADNVGRVVYVSDGSAGSPCAAISDGANWKVIALGANIAAA